MPICLMSDVLKKAKTEKYAVGAFNISSLTFAEAIIEAAEKANSPVILQIAEGHIGNAFDLDIICGAVRVLASRSKVPVVLHLDHGKTLATVINAIKNGFSSIMIDASHLPFEDNVRETKFIVDLCHSVGIPVEGELGALSGYEANMTGDEIFTNPNQAKLFVEETKIDSLAVSIGNAHGCYKGEPKLDFDRLDNITKLTNIPIVLHGGSGISDADFKKAISLGICKINFYTGNCIAASKAIDSFLQTDPIISGNDILDLFNSMKKNVIATVTHNIEVFGSVNKA